MNIQKAYNFFFHPLDLPTKKATGLSLLTITALSILSAGTYLIAFIAIQLRDKNIKKIASLHSPQIQNTAKVAQNTGIISPQKTTPPPTISKKVENEKRQHKQQLEKFEKLAKANDWETFHNAHYD